MNKQAIEALKADIEKLAATEGEAHEIIVKRISNQLGCCLEDGGWECLYGRKWQITGIRVYGMDIHLSNKHSSPTT